MGFGDFTTLIIKSSIFLPWDYTIHKIIDLKMTSNCQNFRFWDLGIRLPLFALLNIAAILCRAWAGSSVCFSNNFVMLYLGLSFTLSLISVWSPIECSWRASKIGCQSTKPYITWALPQNCGKFTWIFKINFQGRKFKIPYPLYLRS